MSDIPQINSQKLLWSCFQWILLNSVLQALSKLMRVGVLSACALIKSISKCQYIYLFCSLMCFALVFRTRGRRERSSLPWSLKISVFCRQELWLLYSQNQRLYHFSSRDIGLWISNLFWKVSFLKPYGRRRVISEFFWKLTLFMIIHDCFDAIRKMLQHYSPLALEWKLRSFNTAPKIDLISIRNTQFGRYCNILALRQ